MSRISWTLAVVKYLDQLPVNIHSEKKGTSGCMSLFKGEDGGRRNWTVACSQNLTVFIDECNALLLPEMKEGLSGRESSTGKSPIFELTVTAITAASCHNYHRGLELIAKRWYKVIFMTGLFDIVRQAGGQLSIFCGPSLPSFLAPDLSHSLAVSASLKRNTSAEIKISQYLTVISIIVAWIVAGNGSLDTVTQFLLSID